MRLLLSLWLAGCAGASGGGAAEDPAEEEELASDLESPGTTRGEAMPSVSYEKTAEGNWERGEAAFADEEYLVAQRYYTYIKTKYPYSQYAVRSELRIADCQFERQRYLESIDAYQNFVRLHPTHEAVPYAYFRVGVAFYEQIPGDWFILPPSEEKDQSSVTDAAKALKSYIDDYPNDPNQAAAKKLHEEVRRKLMAHEQYVADFYSKVDRPRARVGRLETIRREFADVGLTDALLMEIAEIWAALGEAEKVKNAVEELGEKFPASDLLPRAKALLGPATSG